MTKQQTIQFSGNGAAFSEGLKTNSFLRRGNKLILIDLAQENFSAYKESGIFNGVEEVHVVLTHTHGDHASGIGDLGLFSFFSMEPSFTKKLKVYAPSAISNDVKLLMRIFGCTSMHFDFVEITDTVTIADVKFSPIKVEHVVTLECFGYIIEVDAKTIYYSGDANAIPENIYEDFNNGVFDEFYQDTCIAEYPGNVHLPLSLLMELIPAEKRSGVFLMHLDEGFPFDVATENGFKAVELYLSR